MIHHGTRLFDLEHGAKTNTMDRLDKLAVTAPIPTVRSIPNDPDPNQTPHRHHPHRHPHTHHHHPHHPHHPHHAHHRSHHKSTRRHGHVYKTPEQVQRAHFDQELHHVQQELKIAIGKHTAQATSAVIETKRFMKKINQKLEQNKQTNLKNKLKGSIHKLSLINSKKTQVSQDNRVFLKQQEDLRRKAEATAKNRHRLVRHNLLELGSRHESIIRSTTPKYKDRMKFSKPHKASDFKMTAGVRHSPGKWYIWNPNLGLTDTESRNTSSTSINQTAHSASTTAMPKPPAHRRGKHFNNASPRRTTIGKKDKKTPVLDENEGEGAMRKTSQCATNFSKSGDATHENDNISGDDSDVEWREYEDHDDLDDHENHDDHDDNDDHETASTQVEQHEIHRKGPEQEQSGSGNHLFRMKPTTTLHENEPYHVRRQMGKNDFMAKQNYISAITRQQQIKKEHGAHKDIHSLDNRPSTRTGMSGYIAHRLESGLPVEPLKSLNHHDLNNTNQADDRNNVTLGLANMGMSDVLFLSVVAALETSHLGNHTPRQHPGNKKNGNRAGTSSCENIDSDRKVIINLEGNRIGKIGLIALSRCLQGAGGYLSTLNMNRNRLTRSCGDPLGRILNICSTRLIELCLSGCCINDETLHLMACAFLTNSSTSAPTTASSVLQKLVLSDNIIHGTNALVDMLKGMPFLSTLELQSNKISAHGAVQLFRGCIDYSHHLHTLDVSLNAIGKDSFISKNNTNDTMPNENESNGITSSFCFSAGQALGNLLQQNVNLAHLKVEHCSFDPEELGFIATGIESSSSLLSVHLAGNPRHLPTVGTNTDRSTDSSTNTNTDKNIDDHLEETEVDEKIDAPLSAVRMAINRTIFQYNTKNNNNTTKISSASTSLSSSSSMMAQHVTTPFSKGLARDSDVSISSLCFNRELGAGPEAEKWCEVEACRVCESWRSHTLLSHSLETSRATLFASSEERKQWEQEELMEKKIQIDEQIKRENRNQNIVYSSSSSSSSESEDDSDDENPVNPFKHISNHPKDRQIHLLYPHHRFIITRKMVLDSGTEALEQPRYHLNIGLPEGRTIYFFQVVCPDITEYYIDADQHHAVAPVWIQKRYKLSHVNFFDMLPPKQNFHESHAFNKEESIFHELVPSQENNVVDALVRDTEMFKRLILNSVIDIDSDEDGANNGMNPSVQETTILQVLEDNCSLLIHSYMFACCHGEIDIVSGLDLHGFMNLMVQCHVIDKSRIRSQDVNVVFRATCKEQSYGKIVHQHQHHHHHHGAGGKKAKKKKRRKKVDTRLTFPGYLLALVRISIIKYQHTSHDDGECVDKLLKRNLFQAGVLVLEPFRTKYLYQSNTYQCIHENEGLFNSLFRRFCLKHPTTVEQADRRRTKETRTGRHSKRQTKTIEHRLNLPEFFDVLEQTNTVFFTIGDRNQPTRQEISWIFRCASGIGRKGFLAATWFFCSFLTLSHCFFLLLSFRVTKLCYAV